MHAANVDKYGVSFFTLLQSVGSVASIKHGGEDHACCGHLEVTAINFHLQLLKSQRRRAWEWANSNPQERGFISGCLSARTCEQRRRDISFSKDVEIMLVGIRGSVRFIPSSVLDFFSISLLYRHQTEKFLIRAFSSVILATRLKFSRFIV